jgi:hypothetical protein
VEQIPLAIECQYRGRLDAALRLRWVERGEVLGLVQVVWTVEHPNQVVIVDGEPGDAAERPFVRQRKLGPRAVKDERLSGAILLRTCVWRRLENQPAQDEEQRHDDVLGCSAHMTALHAMSDCRESVLCLASSDN